MQVLPTPGLQTGGPLGIPGAEPASCLSFNSQTPAANSSSAMCQTAPGARRVGPDASFFSLS